VTKVSDMLVRLCSIPSEAVRGSEVSLS
jgi:hypothetical protein